MQVRYRETGKTDEVEFRYNPVDGIVLVGRGNPFDLEDDAVPGPAKPYRIAPDTFEDWEVVEASDLERRRLQEAGFVFD
jgi:hypothetical protein